MAGSVPQMLYARLDIARFRSIYATRGRWALLDELASLPVASGAEEDVSQALAHPEAAVPPDASTAQAMASKSRGASLDVVEAVVRRVAAAVLGPDTAEGALLSRASRVSCLANVDAVCPFSKPYTLCVGAAHVLKARRSPFTGTIRCAARSVYCGAGPDGRFAAGSLDSLAAVELGNALAAELGLVLPGTLVFDYPSARAMAAFLHQQLAGPGAAPPRAAAPTLLAGGMGQAGGAGPSTRQLLRVCLCPDMDGGASHPGFLGRRACPLDTQT